VYLTTKIGAAGTLQDIDLQASNHGVISNELSASDNMIYQL